MSPRLWIDAALFWPVIAGALFALYWTIRLAIRHETRRNAGLDDAPVTFAGTVPR